MDGPSGGGSRRRGRGEARASRGLAERFTSTPVRLFSPGRRSIRELMIRGIRHTDQPSSHSTTIVPLSAPRVESSGRHFARGHPHRLGESRVATASACPRGEAHRRRARSRSLPVTRPRLPTKGDEQRRVSPPPSSSLPTDDVSRILRRSTSSHSLSSLFRVPDRARSQAPIPTHSAPPSATRASSSFPSGATSRPFPSR